MLLMLLIFVGIIAATFISVFAKANSRMQHADKRNALRTFNRKESRPPSWAKDTGKVQEFLYVVGNLAVHNGVPKNFATQAVAILTNAFFALAQFAGAIEAEGASFNAQKLASEDMLYTLWNNATKEECQLLVVAYEGSTQLES